MGAQCRATLEGSGPVPATWTAAPAVACRATVGTSGDDYERQADAVADVVTGAAGGAPAPPPADDELARSVGGAPAVQRRERPGGRAPDETALHEAVRTVSDGGTALPGRLGREVGAAPGTSFEQVRIHADAPAGRAAASIGARAFTSGHHIAFGPGEFAPETHRGRWLLAHELTHVVQQRHAGTRPDVAASAPARVQRQPAPAPAPVALLTEAEIRDAIDYNDRRFTDPWTIAVIRELIGIAKYPAVSDRDLALGIAHWQDTHPPLGVDGKVGVGTTRTITAALDAAGSPGLGDDVRVDHPIYARTNPPVVRTVPSPAAHGLFRLNAGFRTTLRRGWIIQEIRNTWNEVLCGGTAHPNPPTARYWEAWWVTNGGNVRLPTSVATPPTTAVIGATHDTWQRGLPAGTRGNFTMRARLYAAQRLPAGFAVSGVADAGVLPATTVAPNADDLGLVQGTRRETGRWNGCPPPAINSHTA